VQASTTPTLLANGSYCGRRGRTRPRPARLERLEALREAHRRGGCRNGHEGWPFDASETRNGSRRREAHEACEHPPSHRHLRAAPWPPQG